MKVLTHNVFEPWPLKDKSIQAIMTSPPYWGCREFEIPNVSINGWVGQYGLEPKRDMYIEHTLLWIKEAERVLRNDGCFFLNIGDMYGGSWGDAKNKRKQLVPARIAIALADAGWYFRNELIWYKKGMPDSSQSKFMGRYEMIYFFTKEPHYYSDLDAVRVPYKKDSVRRNHKAYGPSRVPKSNMPNGKVHKKNYSLNPKGANPGDVWEIPPKPSKLKHYAMWPPALVERLMKFSTRPGDPVLDPFIGSGTTGQVGISLGREVIGFDLGYEEVRKERLGLTT